MIGTCVHRRTELDDTSSVIERVGDELHARAILRCASCGERFLQPIARGHQLRAFVKLFFDGGVA